MQEAGVSEQWLKKQLKQRDVADAADVFLLTVDGDMNVTLQMKNKE